MPMPDLLDLLVVKVAQGQQETVRSTHEVETDSDHTAIADVLLLRHSKNLKFGRDPI